MKTSTERTVLFGPYALNLRSGELHKFGTKVKMGEGNGDPGEPSGKALDQ